MADGTALEYMRTKVDPVFVPLLEKLLAEQPEDVAAFLGQHFSQGGASSEPCVDEATLRQFLGDMVPPGFSGTIPEVCAALGLPVLPGRPRTAVGTFLRIITLNDICTYH